MSLSLLILVVRLVFLKKKLYLKYVINELSNDVVIEYW